MADHIKIRKSPGTWIVRAGGAILGETTQALELTEGEMAPMIYFPRGHVAMAFLDKTDKSTHCPHKGEASYYSIVTKSQTLENACWSYETPLNAMGQITGYLAFYSSETVTLEQI